MENVWDVIRLVIILEIFVMKPVGANMDLAIKLGLVQVVIQVG